MKKNAIISSIVIILTYLIIFVYFLFARDVKIFEENFPRDTKILNLTNYPIDVSDEWIDKLGSFRNLETVKIEDKTISIDKKNYLIKLYPNIIFDIVTTIDIYDQTIREDETYIDLSNTNIDDSIIDLLEQFPKLEKINLSNQKLEINKQLELISKYPNILFEWDVEILDRTVNSSITELDLSNSNVSDIESFKNSLKLLQNLKYLNMSDCNLSNEELGALREEFPNIKIVWKLYFGVWSMQTDAVAFSVLITNFPYTRLKSSDIEFLKYTTDLQALDLGHQALTDLTPIAEYVPNLRILILADNKITDISPLSKLKHLHYLELFMNRVTDLSPLVECKELVDLNLSNVFTLSDVSPLLNNDFPVLERLWINKTLVSYNDYLALKEKYPNATIINTGSGSTNSGWRTHERYFAMIDMYYKKNYISELFTKYDN